MKSLSLSFVNDIKVKKVRSLSRRSLPRKSAKTTRNSKGMPKWSCTKSSFVQRPKTAQARQRPARFEQKAGMETSSEKQNKRKKTMRHLIAVLSRCVPATGQVENNESSKKALGEALDVMKLNVPSVEDEQPPPPRKKELTEEEIAKRKVKSEAGYAYTLETLTLYQAQRKKLTLDGRQPKRKRRLIRIWSRGGPVIHVFIWYLICWFWSFSLFGQGSGLWHQRCCSVPLIFEVSLEWRPWQ